MSELGNFIETQKRKLEQEKAAVPGPSGTKDRSRTSPREYKPDSRHDDSSRFISPQKRTPPKVDKEVEFGGLKLGGYEKVQQKLRKERHEDYIKHLAEKNLRSTGQVEPSYVDDRKSPLSETPVEKEQLGREKARDVEPYLRHREWDTPRGRRRGKENWDVESSPRGNDYSRDPYSPPENLFESYEEKLRKKRAQERRYRGSDDPHFDDDRPMKLTASQYKFNSRSDGFLTRRYDDDDYEQGYSLGRPRGQRDRRLQESKRVRFHEDRDNEMWVKPRRRLKDEYEDEEEDPFDWTRNTMRRRNSAHMERRYPNEGDLHVQRSKTDSTLRSQSVPVELEAGLFGGSQDSSNANQKRKELYKKELQAQMEEQKQTKKREKMTRLGIGENAVKSREPGQISPAEHQQSQRLPLAARQQQQDLGLARDNYGPSARSQGHSALYPSPYDDPYFYYGTMEAGMNQGPSGALNTQVPPGYGGVEKSGFASVRSTSGAPAQTSHPTHQPPGGQTTLSLGVVGNGSGAARDDKEKKRAVQQTYQEELKIQMEIKQRKKQQEQEERERYEQKKNEEIAQYDPWGKGGAGAPLKDSSGRAITNLRSMHNSNKDGTIVSPRDPPRESTTELLSATPVVTDANAELSPRAKNVGFGRSDPLKEPQPQDEARKVAKFEYQQYLKQQVEENEKRKKEEQEKIRREDELQEQRMEEQRKNIQLQYEKEQAAAREKEEAVRRKLEEQKAEQETKKKDIERKRKEMEEERRVDLRRKLGEEMTAKTSAVGGGSLDSLPHARTISPPVPVVRKKQESNDQDLVDSGRRSPPVPTLIHQPKSRQEHTEVMRYPASPFFEADPEPIGRVDADQDVLSQLTALRQQLKNEENRIQSQMDRSTAVTTFSSSRRQEEVSSAHKRSSKRDVDVFERALSNRPAASKKDSETFSAAAEFNRIKSDDTSSLAGEFRSRFPVAATTASTLDLQQQEFLREQEDHLTSLRSGDEGSTNQPQANGSVHQISTRPVSRTSMLESDSQFLAIEDSSKVDLPPESMGVRPRQSSARQRRRLKQLEELAKDPKPFGVSYKPPTPGGFSLNSITSFNVDEVALRNEERLRKLETSRKDERKADPDQVLRRFIQERQRPLTRASETSLLEAETSFEPI